MSDKKKEKSPATMVGGQALMEGILMRGPKKQAIVINTKDGFVTKTEEVRLPKDKYPILGLFLIRGIANFIHTMIIGMRALTYSTEIALDGEEEEESESKFDRWLNEKLGEKNAEKVIIAIAVVLAIVLVLGLFIFLPAFLSGLLADAHESNLLRNISEGLLRIIIFIAYLWLATRLKDIKRVWAYHGAEHKAIYCYEKGLPLTIENVQKQSKEHPRCGTSFLFVVIVVSILVFSFTTVTGIWMRVAMRLLLLPIVVAISYEFIRVAGKYDNWFMKIVTAPGRAMQKLTTAEPDEKMIETAIVAISQVIPEAPEGLPKENEIETPEGLPKENEIETPEGLPKENVIVTPEEVIEEHEVEREV